MLLDVIYAFERVPEDEKVTITQLSGIEKLLTLRHAKEMNLFFHESIQLVYLGEIVQKVSLYKVAVPWSLDRLNEVYDTIIQHHSHLNNMT